MTLESTLVVDRTWKFRKLAVMPDPFICNPLGALKNIKMYTLIISTKYRYYEKYETFCNNQMFLRVKLGIPRDWSTNPAQIFCRCYT